MDKEYEIDLTKYKRHRSIRRLPFPPSKETGVFYFGSYLKAKGEKKHNWKKVSEIPFEVIKGKMQIEE